MVISEPSICGIFDHILSKGLEGHRNIRSHYVHLLPDFSTNDLLFYKGSPINVGMIVESVKGNKSITLGISLLLITTILVFLNSERWDLLRLKAFSVFNYSSEEVIDSHHNYPGSNTVYDRFLLLKNTVEMISEKPFLGSGLGNWKLLFPKYGMGGRDYLNSGILIFQRPHNDYLWILAESGAFGLLAYLLFFFVVFKRVFKVIRSSNSSKDKTLIILCFLAIVGFMMDSIFNFQRGLIQAMAQLMLLVSLIFVYDKSSLQKVSLSNRKQSGLLFGVLILLALTLTYLGSRFQSERFLTKAIYAKTAEKWKLVSHYIDRSSSSIYNLDGSSTPLLWYRGLANYKLGNEQQACENFSMAEMINPTHLYTLNNIGSCYKLQGDKDMAIQYYKRALKITPRFHHAVLNLAKVYYEVQEYDLARQTLVAYPFKKDRKYKKLINLISETDLD
ncbi:MAG: tetratricopeptide repeat protein [Bacteroidetes bacterium]|nr:tetratricopeptide repeat protein [Bacteroidota bacterium]